MTRIHICDQYTGMYTISVFKLVKLFMGVH